MVTRVLAKELRPTHIRVNAINPGMVETEGFKGRRHGGIRLPQASRGADSRSAASASPRDIATAAVFLASADSAWITGETLLVSGGMR